MSDSPPSDRPHGLAIRHVTRWLSYLAGAALLAAVILPVTARADDQDVIDYRQHIMNTMGDQMVLINQILQKQASADNLATYAQILAISAGTAESAFKPNVAGGKSKPNVWTNWTDFSKQLDQLVAGAADLQKAAAAGDTAAVASKVAALNCMSCHNTYMQK